MKKRQILLFVSIIVAFGLSRTSWGEEEKSQMPVLPAATESATVESATVESATAELSEAAIQQLKTEAEQIVAERFSGPTSDYFAFFKAKGEKLLAVVEKMLTAKNLSTEDANFALNNGLVAIRILEENKTERFQKQKAFLDRQKDRPEILPFYREWISWQFYEKIDFFYDRAIPNAEKAALFRQMFEPLAPWVNLYYLPDRNSTEQFPSEMTIVADQIDPDGSEGLVTWTVELIKPTLERDAQGDEDELLTFCAKSALALARSVKMLGQPMEYEWFDLDGQPISIGDFKGKIVLILFPDYWFEPTLPVLRKIYDQLHDAGLEIITHDESIQSAEELRNRYENEPLPWIATVRYPPNAYDQNDLHYIARRRGSFVVNREGNVILSRSDLVSPELCAFLKTIFPEKEAELDEYANELKAILDESDQKQKNETAEGLLRKVDDTDFGRLLRLHRRLLYEPATAEIQLEIIDRLLAFPESQQIKNTLYSGKLRFLDDKARQEIAKNPLVDPDIFWTEINAFYEKVLQEEDVPPRFKASFSNYQINQIYYRIDRLKKMTEGEAEYAEKTIDWLLGCFQQYDRFCADIEGMDYDISSPKTQMAFFLAQELESLDEKLGTHLEAKMYETFIPYFAESKSFNERELAKQYEGSLRRLSIIGKPFELEAVLQDGTTINVADWRGKVVLVNFWGTTCGPCLREFPTMKAIYEKYHEKGYEMIALSYDSQEELDEFLAKNPYPWLFSLLKDAKEKGLKDYYQYYGISAIPTTFILDRDGNVSYFQVGYNDELIQAAVDKLFSEPQ